MIQVEVRYKGGEWCNCYIVGDEGEDCFIVDDGFDMDGYLTGYALKHHPRILGILLTHSHIDHTYGLLQHHPDCQVFLGMEDEGGFSDPFYNESPLLGLGKLTIDDISPYLVEDEDEIKLGRHIIKVIATPFHTRGSVCYYLEDDGILFSGDTLFCRGVGRYDLKGSCPRFMKESLGKLFKLPGLTKVYPGHGKATRIDIERSYLGF